MAPPAPAHCEIELKLALDPAAMPSLMRHALVAASRSGRTRTARLVSDYYDTARGTLARAGVALRIRRDAKRFVQTVKAQADPRSTGALAVRREYEWRLPGPTVDAASLASTPWAPLFRKAIKEGLERRFTTDVLRRHVPLSLGAGTRALLCVDTGAIRARGTRRTLPVSELEIEIVDGGERAVLAFARSLCETLPATILVQSKAERGMALATGDRAAPARARDVKFAGGATAVGALAAIARECLRHVAANAQGVVTDPDPEWVHQMRVGTRRLRACVRLIARTDHTVSVDALAAELEWLAGVLGEARDLDVFATETLPPIRQALRDDGALAAPLTQLARRIGSRRRIARAQVRAALASMRYTKLVLAAGELIAGLDIARAQPAASSAAELLAHRHRSLRRRAGALEQSSGDDERHAARIDAKKLRYAAEFFATLYPERRVRRYLRALADLQRLLGNVNDARTAARIATEAGPEPAAFAVRAYTAAHTAGQLEALRKGWKTFERARPFWKRA